MREQSLSYVQQIAKTEISKKKFSFWDRKEKIKERNCIIMCFELFVFIVPNNCCEDNFEP